MTGWSQDDDFFNCPHCGARVSLNASFCRECGSDADTGWAENAESSQFDGLGDDDFEYDAYLEREFPGERLDRSQTNWKKNVLVLVILATCLGMLFLLF